MRSPDNYIQVYSNSADEVIEITNMPEMDIQEYDLFDDKEFTKYINDAEKIVRSSFEYRMMTNYMRENLDMGRCSFYQNVSNEQSFKIKIELHHEPITLHDLCTIVFNKRNSYGESADIELLAKEVMYVHYLNLVGLIPLSITVHELVHNNYLFIPSDMVYGNYKKFVSEYGEFMEPEHIDTLNRIEEATMLYNHATNIEVLDRKYIYVDASGAYNIPSSDDIKNMLKSRILEIKAENKIDFGANEFDNNKKEEYCPFVISK